MVDRDGLENRCTERYRGFESLLLRFRRDSNPRGSGGETPPGHRGDRQRCCRQRGRAPMKICFADLGSRPKAGIPPAPLAF